MSDKAPEKPKTAKKLSLSAIRRYDNRWLSSASIALVLLFALGGTLYHFVYVEQRRSGLHEHHLHLLRRAAADVEDTLIKLDENIRNATQGTTGIQNLPQDLRNMAGLTDVPAEPDTSTCEWDTGVGDDTCYVMGMAASQPRLRVYVSEAKADTVYGVEANLHRLFSGLFPVEAFDAIFLIRESDGQTVYDPSDLLRPPQERRGRLGPLTFRRYARLPDSSLDVTAIHADTIAGEAYTAFVQPVRVPFKLSYNEPPRTRTTWHLVGLRRAPDLTAEARLISPILLLISIAIGVIALLSLPVLKVYYIGLRERLATANVLYAALAVGVTVSLLTTVLMEGLTYRSYKHHRAAKLQELANNIKWSFCQEIKTLDEQLTRLNGSLPELVLEHDSSDALKMLLLRLARSESMQVRDTLLAELDTLNPRVENLLPQERSSNDTLFGTYPFLIHAFWLDEQGEQLFKAGTGTVTPRTSVASRDYFKHARTKDSWARETSATWYLESIRGKVNGQVSVALSQQRDLVALDTVSPPRNEGASLDSIPVIPVAATRLLSLHDPVLPQGMGFSVIGPSGRVLFHHDETKNLRENLLSRISEPALAVAIMRRVPDQFSVRYWNRLYQVATSPIAGTPWTLVVFDDLEMTRTLYGQVLVNALALTIVYYLFLVVLAPISFLIIVPFILRLTARQAPPRPLRMMILQFWPGALHPGDHGVLLITGGFLLFLYLTLMQYSSGLVSLVILPLAATLFLLCVLWWTALQGEARRLVTPGPHSHRHPWGVLCALLLIGSVFPALLFYRVGHDEAIALHAKAEHVTLSNALQNRQAKLSNRFRKTLSLWDELCENEQVGSTAAPQNDMVRAALYPIPLDTAWDIHLPSDYQVRCGSSQLGSNNGLAKQALAPHLPLLRSTALNDMRANLVLAEAKQGLQDANSGLTWTADKNDLTSTFLQTPQPLVITSTVPTFTYLRGTFWLTVLSIPVVCLLFVGGVVSLRGVPIPSTRKSLRMRSATDLTKKTSPYEIWLRYRGEPGEPDVYLDARDLRYRTPAELEEEAKNELGFDAKPKPTNGRYRIIVRRLFQGMIEPSLLHNKLELIERLTALARRHEQEGRKIRIVLCTDVGPLNRIIGLRSDRDDPSAGSTKTAPEAEGAFNVARWAAALRPFTVRREPTDPLDQLELKAKFEVELMKAEAYAPRSESPEEAPSFEEPSRAFGEELGETPNAVLPSRKLRRRSSNKLREHPKTLSIAIRAILRECWTDYRLQDIGRELAQELVSQPLPLEAVQEYVVGTVYEQAERYYQNFWELSSKDEKVVLYRLATDGLVGQRSRRVLECLEDRGLVLRMPYPVVMNESFRRFVTKAEPEETYEEWRREGAMSTRQRLTSPILLALTLLVTFLLLTQPALVDQSVALVAALGAAVPLFVRILAPILGRRYLSD